ncbi:MAG: hypothetical protein GC190_09315 [Alphaproteobacteria bacterium]|nr:hypothetical protein [Alphaproteobacteria bacterium]
MLKFGYASLLVGALVSIGAISAPAKTDGFVVNAYLGGEIRVYPTDPAWAGQRDDIFWPSAFGQIDATYTWDDGRQQIQVTPYGRYDVYDSRRTHADLREANYSYRGDGWDILIGAHTVFWGRAESRHLVNVINQVDLVENFDSENYLGQPMVNLNFTGEWGKLSLFGMTGFRNQTFADNDGRLRGPIRVAAYNPAFECSADEWCWDFAARYENTFGPLDVGVSYFHGTNREPLFVPTLSGLTPELQPYYQTMDQIGVDAAYAIGDWIFKGEGIYRWNAGNPTFSPLGMGADHFFAMVAGGEYTIRDPFQEGFDLGVLAEYNWDDRDFTQPGTIYTNGVFAGLRLTLNDDSDTHALVGLYVDTRDGSSYVYLESSRRVGDDWRVGVEARMFNGNDSNLLQAIDHDSYVQLKATKYFSLTD